jgi:DNA-directed RNA polymerase subunit alpha
MIPLPLPPKIVSQEENKAIFEIEGLYPGYAITIGNSLRRVLLSSLEGAAITEVKIKGVLHEFSTIPNVMEDVIILILNLKRLRFKMHSQEPQTISLSARGEKEVKGKDFKLTSELELINPQEHVATLTRASAELQLEAQVERGVGYEPVERREIKKSEVGVLPLDAIFTPVKKVSFSIENMRVGKRTDYGLLRLEIETDGTMEPETALHKSAEILVKQFSVVAESGQLAQEKPAKPEKKSAPVSQTPEELEEVKKIKVEDFKISERTKNVLLKNSLKTVSGITRKSESDLLGLEGMGDKAIAEIKKALKKLNLELKAEKE